MTSPISESKTIRVTLGVLVWFAAIVGTGAIAITSMRSDLGDHGGALERHERRLDALEAKIATDHDLLLEIRGDVKALREQQPKGK